MSSPPCIRACPWTCPPLPVSRPALGHVLPSLYQGLPFDMSAYPKLHALHKAMLAEPRLAGYFAAECYTEYAFNNPAYSYFVGKGYKGDFGPTVDVRRGGTQGGGK
eukprot:scaffold14415_cov96-Isochrysis_galbana.AAC.1